MYTILYQFETCPFKTLLRKNWLVIENATLEDAAKTYQCSGNYVVTNPGNAAVTKIKNFDVHPGKTKRHNSLSHCLSLFLSFSFFLSLPLIPSHSSHQSITLSHFFLALVYQLSEVVTPPNSSNVSFHLKSDETVQWSCSVKAGVGDRLVWTLNEKKLLTVDISDLTNFTLTQEDSIKVSIKWIIFSSFGQGRAGRKKNMNFKWRVVIKSLGYFGVIEWEMVEYMCGRPVGGAFGNKRPSTLKQAINRLVMVTHSLA